MTAENPSYLADKVNPIASHDIIFLYINTQYTVLSSHDTLKEEATAVLVHWRRNGEDCNSQGFKSLSYWGNAKSKGEWVSMAKRNTKKRPPHGYNSTSEVERNNPNTIAAFHGWQSEGAAGFLHRGWTRARRQGRIMRLGLGEDSF